MEVSMMIHVGIIFLLIWALSAFNSCHIIVYFISFIYLYLVHERYTVKLRKKIEFEESKQANQRRVLSDSETVRWLNHAVEKIWPICMEQISSQKILLPIIPWFLYKYKPWTATEAKVHHLYLGRNPPIFRDMRVLHRPSEDDHLVLELGINFLTADDMSAILAVKLRKRLGFGMWAKLHLTGMHIEGKVLVGIKFLHGWPFIGRLRICFAEPPYFQMTVRPLFNHGLDVMEIPGIAGWVDKLLSVAFEQTLVEPNMLVVDMEKFVSPQPESWFSVEVKEPACFAKVEVIEGSDMKPSDPNGLADPYVKGKLGTFKFRTKIQFKTLTPRWQEEFKIPILTWGSQDVLAIEVRDKDHFVDDLLGDCSVNISGLRDGYRHDMWLPLQNIKTGRLRIAITIVEGNIEVDHLHCEKETMNLEDRSNSFASATTLRNSSISSERTPRVADNFEPINIEGQKETGIWVHHPGSEVAQTWEPRKGKSRLFDIIHAECTDTGSPMSHNEYTSGDEKSNDQKSEKSIRKGIRKIFHKNTKDDNNIDQSSPLGSLCEPGGQLPYINVQAVNSNERGMSKVVMEDLSGSNSAKSMEGGNVLESPSRANVKDVAKNIFKHAGRSARNIKLRLKKKSAKKDEGEDHVVEYECSDEESLSSLNNTPRVSEVLEGSNLDRSEVLEGSNLGRKSSDPINVKDIEGPVRQ